MSEQIDPNDVENEELGTLNEQRREMLSAGIEGQDAGGTTNPDELKKVEEEIEKRGGTLGQ